LGLVSILANQISAMGRFLQYLTMSQALSAFQQCNVTLPSQQALPAACCQHFEDMSNIDACIPVSLCLLMFLAGTLTSHHR
jgi:hypothetical protein